jgi:hypothetical protein
MQMPTGVVLRRTADLVPYARVETQPRTREGGLRGHHLGSKEGKAAPNRRQPALLSPVAGDRKRKVEASAEAANLTARRHKRA